MAKKVLTTRRAMDKAVTRAKKAAPRPRVVAIAEIVPSPLPPDALDAYAADSALQQAEPAALARLDALAHEMLRLDLKAHDLGVELEQTATALRALREKDVPDAMAALSLPRHNIANANGEYIEVARKVYAKFPDADKFPERARVARDYLIKQKHGSIIKQSITIEFDATDTKAVKRVIKELMKKNPRRIITERVAVNSRTLAKLVRTELDAGRTMQLELIGAHSVVEATLHRPEKK